MSKTTIIFIQNTFCDLYNSFVATCKVSYVFNLFKTVYIKMWINRLYEDENKQPSSQEFIDWAEQDMVLGFE